MINLSEDTSYGFAVGRVRALEVALLGPGQYDRLLRAAGPDEFTAILKETGYARFFEGAGPGSFDAAMELAAAEYAAFLARYALDPWLLRFFQLPADIHNLRTAVKAARGAGSVPPHRAGGAWSAQSITALVSGAAPPEVESLVQPVVRRLLDEDSRADAITIDVALDRLEAELALAAARPSPFLVGYLQLHSDLENARTAARVKAAGESGADLAGLLLPGGAVGVERLRAAVAGDWDGFARAFNGTEVGDVVSDGAARFAETGALLRWERLGREAELTYLRRSRYAVFGHEPLAAFHYYQLNELRNLRGAYAAQRAGLDHQTARELIAYVD